MAASGPSLRRAQGKSVAGDVELERERIFQRKWFCVGREEQAANPGDYFTADLIDESVVVVRAKDGELRAFHAQAGVGPVAAGELQLIEQLNFARYFLTVHDIMAFAKSQDILCQGRGSAANSVVCYCLGITSVDPAKIDVLFERFISAARNEPPDIDVDFEHERREEVIQYVYEKYGRDRAGLAATVICYRSRSAIREVGKALGLSVDVVAALAGIVWGWSNDPIADQRVREAGLDPGDRNLRLALDLAGELIGFPRHLSQHVGGFVIARGLVERMVPVENAAMADRTVLQWDKDDLDALGLLKVDCLALGSLWLHLRICLECGHVGCCDDSPNKHASAHARSSGHPIIRSLEPGEDWSWCYVDEVAFAVDGIHGNTRIPPSPLLHP